MESAEKEIALWFHPEELVNYKSCAQNWIYEWLGSRPQCSSHASFPPSCRQGPGHFKPGYFGELAFHLEGNSWSCECSMYSVICYHQIKMFHLKERVIELLLFCCIALYSFFRYLANLIECKYHINYLYWPERSHTHTFLCLSLFPLHSVHSWHWASQQLSARDLLSCPNCTIDIKDSLEIKDINIFLALEKLSGIQCLGECEKL